jgi:hypothetical protein
MSSFAENSEPKPEQPQQQQQEDSGVFGGIGSFFGSIPSLFSSGDAEDDAEARKLKEKDKAKISEDEAHHNTLFIKIIRSIRQKMMNRRLFGEITLHYNVSMITTSTQCKVLEDDYEDPSKENIEGIEPGASAKINEIPDSDSTYQRAISMTDSILDALERKAMEWEKLKFSNHATLSRGAQFSINTPIPFLTYSISLNIQASVKTLIESRKYYMEHYDRRFLGLYATKKNKGGKATMNENEGNKPIEGVTNDLPAMKVVADSQIQPNRIEQLLADENRQPNLSKMAREP